MSERYYRERKLVSIKANTKQWYIKPLAYFNHTFTYETIWCLTSHFKSNFTIIKPNSMFCLIVVYITDIFQKQDYSADFVVVLTFRSLFQVYSVIKSPSYWKIISSRVHLSPGIFYKYARNSSAKNKHFKVDFGTMCHRVEKLTDRKESLR